MLTFSAQRQMFVYLRYSTVQYITVQYSTVPREPRVGRYWGTRVSNTEIYWSRQKYFTVIYYIMQYIIVQYSTMKYNTIQCSTLQYNISSLHRSNRETP